MSPYPFSRNAALQVIGEQLMPPGSRSHFSLSEEPLITPTCTNEIKVAHNESVDVHEIPSEGPLEGPSIVGTSNGVYRLQQDEKNGLIKDYIVFISNKSSRPYKCVYIKHFKSTCKHTFKTKAEAEDHVAKHLKNVKFRCEWW